MAVYPPRFLAAQAVEPLTAVLAWSLPPKGRPDGELSSILELNR